MRIAVDFDDEILSGAIEVNNVGADRMLPPEPHAPELISTDARPKR
jgi:hypothetical protein